MTCMKREEAAVVSAATLGGVAVAVMVMTRWGDGGGVPPKNFGVKACMRVVAELEWGGGGGEGGTVMMMRSWEEVEAGRGGMVVIGKEAEVYMCVL